MLKTATFAEFPDEKRLLHAAKGLKEKGVRLIDAYSPFPIHGMDEVLGQRRSRVAIVCFIAASIGCISSMWFQIWTCAQDWPLNVGGKPMISIPAFIPVTFEVTVLFGGLISVAAFLFRCRLFPGQGVRIPNPNVTSDGFWLSVEHQAARIDSGALDAYLRELGASRIQHGEEAA